MRVLSATFLVSTLHLAACGGGSGVGDTATAGRPITSETGGPTETTTGATETKAPTGTADPEPGGPDEELARALIAGALEPAEVIPAIAWSGGWPVETGSGTLLFVHWYDGGDWSVAGDFDGWVPAPMTPGAGFWWAEVPVEEPSGQRYKFVDGSVSPEAWIADPFARSYTYDDFGEISYVDPPTDTWRLDRWPGLEGQGLGPRDVRVYVPAGAGPWPVLYMHDGQNLFDPGAFFGGWRVQDALATLEPALVVGVDNTGVARMDEYTHVADDIGYGYPIGGLGDAYAALIQEDLRPHVEAVYGTTGLDGVLGSSLGGLISLHIAHLYPGEFAFAGSMSGTLGWGAYADLGPTMEALYLADGHLGTALYVDSGGDAGADGACTDADGDGTTEDDLDDGDNYCVTRGFADAMAAQGYAWDVDLWHWHAPGATHDEASWADRVDIPLGIFLSLDD